MEIRRAGVPHRNFIGGGVGKVEVRSRSSGEAHFFRQSSQSLLTSAATSLMGRVNAATEELQLFGESENRPGQSACPCAERRIALLRVRTSEDAIRNVEHGFV